MKTDERTPSEIIKYIGELIREREQKNLPTFYTISIEQFEKTTPVAEKEEGYDNFKAQLLKYMSDYNLTSITIQLFSAKARNVTTPFQTFRVVLKKQNPAVFLGNAGKDYNNEVQQLESSIPVGRYYDEKFELQMRIMRTEMDKQGLSDKVAQLTERYEERIKELEEQISEFENEVAENEKSKHNSFGNIALGSVVARAIEGIAKSDIGQGVLKGLLGQSGYETLQGHLAGIENEKKNSSPEQPPARIISEPETNSNDPRTVGLNYIQKVAQSLPDTYLRMLYDLTEMIEKNTGDLPVLWKIAQQIKQQRGQAPIKKPDEPTHDKKENKENNLNENTE